MSLSAQISFPPPIRPLAEALMEHVVPFSEWEPLDSTKRGHYQRGFKHCNYKSCSQVVNKETMVNIGKAKTPYWICAVCARRRESGRVGT